MMRLAGSFRAITIVASICAFASSDGLVQASPSGHAPHGTVTIDGVTVPDIGPLPTVVPVPSSNLNYAAKIELGKQLYFDGGCQRTTPSLVPSVTIPELDSRIPDRHRSGSAAGLGGASRRRCTTRCLTMCSSGMGGHAPWRSKRSGRSTTL